MSRLGVAMIRAGQAVTLIGPSLQRIASAYGLENVETMTLATGRFIRIRGPNSVMLELNAAANQSIRLDQTADVFRLVRESEHGAIDPRQGLSELDRIMESRARFGPLIAVGGYVILSVSLALV